MINLDNDPKYQQELNRFLQQDYIEDDLLLDVELDLGEVPVGNYSIQLDLDEWVDWYYTEGNTLIEKSLQLIPRDELNSLLEFVDYGMDNPTGLFDGEVLTTIQVNVKSLDEIVKGFENVSKSNLLFLYTVAAHEERKIPTIATKANPTGEQIVPKYYTVKWAKLDRNYINENKTI